ncbi:YegS/Rv2252/BmrU family lipid kinase [Sphingomonas sp. LY54]|uniref:diacylglycerol/lipid kinase family protein n=1 Tax=Sphingomonas sp. LY54 TaxID=3095343 RepID=UPI002D7788F0|nr:YegS/Rv2252/BmrU family lipid kinase [Sphingomonas sp. LY54]WRP28448.1 YegS/Rv2252/BmrU family lipid kinase [Sphingomonas sp. LY54]
MHAPRPVPREAVLVVNAASRKGRDLFREAKTKLEAAGIRITAAYPVRNPRKLTSTMQQAVASGTPMVIVGGGDGSLSGTVDDVVDRDCVFALLPLGTANSFARTLGIPLDLDGAIATIATGKRKRIDLGVLDGDYFANCAAMGLSPMIGEGIPHNLKRYLGRVGYLIWAIYCVFRFRPFKLSIDDGVQKHTIWATEVRIANGRFHGGVELIEQAEVDSGDIVIQAVVGRSMAHLLWDWFAKYFKLPAREAAHEEFRGQQLRIDTKPRQKISIDGEVLAKTPAVVEVAHKAIEVVVPA